MRLMDLIGVKLTPGVVTKIQRDPNQVTFFESDIVSIEPRVCKGTSGSVDLLSFLG